MVAVDEMSNVRKLMCDAGCTGDEDGVAIGVEGMVTCIGAFKGCSDCPDARADFVGFVVEAASEAFLGLNDKGDVGNRVGLVDLDVHGFLGEREDAILGDVVDPRN